VFTCVERGDKGRREEFFGQRGTFGVTMLGQFAKNGGGQIPATEGKGGAGGLALPKVQTSGPKIRVYGV